MTCFPSACFMYIDWRNEEVLISICCHIKKMWTTYFPKLHYVWMILQRSGSWACIQFRDEMNWPNKEGKLNYFYPYFISLTFTFSAPPSIISFSLTVTVSPLKCCLARKILPACHLSLSLIQTWMKSERVFLLTSGGLVRSFTIYGWEWKPYGSVLRGLCSYLNILDSNLEYRNSLLSFSRNPTCLR